MDNTDYGLIYYTVLTDTPLSKYFDMYINKVKLESNITDIEEVFEKMNQQDSKVLRMLLKKMWIEDFHNQCFTIGGETFRVMDALLRFEADCMTVQFI